MNVLLLTQILPYPPDSGPKVKTWNLIKYLGPRHNLTLVSFVRGDQSQDMQALQAYCRAVHGVPLQRGIAGDAWAMLLSLVTNQPWMMTRDDRRAMHGLIARLAQETPFDVVHADQLNMGQYALRAPAKRTVLDEHNALWLLYRRLAATMRPGLRRGLLERDWRLLKRYEGQMCLAFDEVLAVSEPDRQALVEAAGRARPIHVLPIAIDTDEVTTQRWQPGAHRILHIGTMFWPPNIDGVLWFIEEIYPQLRARYPDLVFDVIGDRPPQTVLDWGQAGLGINVTGYLADPTPLVEQAGVMVIPLRAGGGMRVKILNALAQGLPMVTTSLGCEGIAVEHGRHLMIADTPADFARAVQQVLDDSDLARRLSQNARELACTTYDYRQVYRPLDQIYQAAGNGHA